MSWERGVTISAEGTSHCHGIKATSAKGFMVASLSNPHIYISPCALLNYARLLDYFDFLLANTGSSQGRLSGSTVPPTKGHQRVSLARDQGDKEVYLWAIDRLRKQIMGLGATPLVHLPGS